MSRLRKAFLRNSLNGATHVAGFGKHPAWDDHIDDIGIATETLVLTKQLLYSEGIASQLASGAWDQIEKSGQAIEFAHRFVWARDEQSIVGAIWASADRKGRTRFPMAACIQAGCDGLAATQMFLAPIERLSSLCKAAQTQEEVRNSFEQTRAEISGPMFHSTTFSASERQVAQIPENTIMPALVTLSAGLKNRRSRGSGKAGRSSRAYFRLPTASNPMKENLEFWSGYVARHRNPDWPYLIIAPIAKSWIDLIVGEPISSDFYCLRANETALPIASLAIEGPRTRKLEAEARNYLQMLAVGPDAVRQIRRSWWSRLLARL
jgi:hypothetical protein